jgi:hypothetical protein
LRQGIAQSNPAPTNLSSKRQTINGLRKDQRAEAVGKLEEMVKWLKKL